MVGGNLGCAADMVPLINLSRKLKMINLKSFKWGYGVVVSFAIGLTGCYMDGHRAQQMETMQTHHQKMVTNANQTKAMHKTSATAAKEPAQQVAPGPKRKAAPQLPVIQ
jgi:hypothetical protein